MLEKQTITQPIAAKNVLAVSLARDAVEVREVQHLRYKVFVQEMGATPSSAVIGLDCDEFDAVCDHLLVRDTKTGEVVGTYRILSAERAGKIGGFYSEQEFDFQRLSHLRPRMVEIGRSCVHPDYRGGAVIALLWSGLAEYLLRREHDYLIGCASVSMSDGGHTAANLYRKLSAEVMSPVEWRVFPRAPLPLSRLGDDTRAVVPPLIKAYLRVGAYICGEPSWDGEFNCADFMMLLSIKTMNEQYARHFMKAA